MRRRGLVRFGAAPLAPSFLGTLQDLAGLEDGPSSQNEGMVDGVLVQEICGRLDRGEIDRDQFFDRLTRAVADQIGCTRCGVWVFVDTAGGRALRCMAMYDRRVDRIVGEPLQYLASGCIPQFSADNP